MMFTKIYIHYFIVTFLFITCVSSAGFSQSNKTKDVDLGLVGGFLLPQNITGLNSNFTMSGVRIAKGISAFRPEFLFLQGKEDGGEFMLFDFSIKNRLFVDDLGGIRPIWTIGWHYARYRRPDQGSTSFDYVNSPGLHYGFGMEIPIVSNLSLRNDFSLSNGPGRLLVISLGLQWTFQDDKSSNPD